MKYRDISEFTMKELKDELDKRQELLDERAKYVTPRYAPIYDERECKAIMLPDKYGAFVTFENYVYVVKSICETCCSNSSVIRRCDEGCMWKDALGVNWVQEE